LIIFKKLKKILDETRSKFEAAEEFLEEFLEEKNFLKNKNKIY